MKWPKIALLLVLLVCAWKAVHSRLPVTLEDFDVYDTAATLVREHHSLLMYNGADTGADPQVRYAPADTLFAREAQRIGIPQVRMYVYPPILADVIAPLSFLGVKQAGRLWTAVNIAALVAFFVLVLATFRIRFLSAGALALAVGIVTAYPVLSCVRWGQIVVILLLLWTVGVYCYVRGWKEASALALALATAIKLTPLIVVIPFLLWREWRWLRAYAIGLFALFGGVIALNGFASLSDFFQHVMPAMSNGYPSVANRTIISACQEMYVALHGGDPRRPLLTAIPHGVLTLGKVLDLVCLSVAGSLLAKGRLVRDVYARAAALGLFAMLSVIFSPVSWEHAYIFCLLGLAVLWVEALRVPVPKGYVLLLALCSLELNWFTVSYLLWHFAHGVLFGLTTFTPVVFTLALVYYRLAAIPQFAQLAQNGGRAEWTAMAA